MALRLLLLGIGLSRTLASTNSSDCDASCRGQLGSAYETAQHSDPDFGFYTVPSNFSSALPPGSLLRVEDSTDLTNFSVPSGLTVSRLIYTTTDLNDTVLPTSAYVLWPYIPAHSAGNGSQAPGYPMVAWAHGTSGLFRDCAPSNYRNLQYHFMAPFLLALQGMVVVAPDYAGLGIDTLPSGEHIGHTWIAGPARANDLANAITAARAAFPDLLKPDGPFVAMGHSQGGNAVWAFAERQAMADKYIDGYKGTVAIAPPTNIISLVEEAQKNTSAYWASSALTVQPRIIAAVTAQYPAYNYSGMTPTAYERYIGILKPLSGCLPTDTLVFAGLPLDQLAYANWTQDPTVQEAVNTTKVSRKKFKGPFLVLAGEADPIVPVDILADAVNNTCKMMKDSGDHESLEMITYSGMSHFPVIQASSMKWLAWIKQRLSAHGHIQPGCKRSSIDGFRTEFTVQSVTPNFLEQWAPASEQWKYLL